MRGFSAGLNTHIAGITTSLATIIKITLNGTSTANGSTVLGFTDTDTNLTVSGITYYANRGYWRFAMEFTDGLEANTTEAEWLLDSSGLTEDDLRKEILRGAKYELSFVNFKSPTTVSPVFKRGWLGKVTLQGPSIAKVELLGFRQWLQTVLGKVVTKNCPFDLGDADCQFAVASVTASTTVASVTSSRVFSVNSGGLNGEADYYTGGLVTFTAVSPNALNERARPAEIKSYTPGVSGGGAAITLFESMPFRVGVGDAVSLAPGCDKTQATCIAKFNNIVHYGGFPFLKYDAAYMYGKGNAV